EPVEEVGALARVEVPRVLAVQGHDDKEVAVLALLVADAPKAVHEVADRVARRHAVVVEADQVAEQAVAEHDRDGAALALHPPRLVEELRLVQAAHAIAAGVADDGAAQAGVVAAEPRDAGWHGRGGHALP